MWFKGTGAASVGEQRAMSTGLGGRVYGGTIEKLPHAQCALPAQANVVASAHTANCDWLTTC